MEEAVIYRMIISTSNSYLEMNGTFEECLVQLKDKVTVNRPTTMVEIDLSSVEKENNAILSQIISKKSRVNVLVRFEQALDEITAILGVFQSELEFLGGV